MFMKMAQLEASESSHVTRDTLLGAIQKEQSELQAAKSGSSKYESGSEDNSRSVFAN